MSENALSRLTSALPASMNIQWHTFNHSISWDIVNAKMSGTSASYVIMGHFVQVFYFVEVDGNCVGERLCHSCNHVIRASLGQLCLSIRAVMGCWWCLILFTGHNYHRVASADLNFIWWVWFVQPAMELMLMRSDRKFVHYFGWLVVCSIYYVGGWRFQIWYIKYCDSSQIYVLYNKHFGFVCLPYWICVCVCLMSMCLK